MGLFLRLCSCWTIYETRERERERARARERGFRMGVRGQYTAPSSYVFQNFRFLRQTSSKTETSFLCYTERNVNECILNGSVSQSLFMLDFTKWERDIDRGGGLQKGCAQRVQTVHPLVMYVKIANVCGRPPQKLKQIFRDTPNKM